MPPIDAYLDTSRYFYEKLHGCGTLESSLVPLLLASEQDVMRSAVPFALLAAALIAAQDRPAAVLGSREVSEPQAKDKQTETRKPQAEAGPKSSSTPTGPVSPPLAPRLTPVIPTEPSMLGPAPSPGLLSLTSFAPNILGDLLGTNRSVFYFLNRSQGAVDVNAFGATAVTNVKIGDNNSPVPQDRIAFRYNHFDRALAVTGIGDAAPFLDPSLGPFVSRQPLQTQKFDVESYTVSLEKTFWDGRLSVETRMPFNTGLSSHLNLSVGQVTSLSEARVTDQFGQVFHGVVNPSTGAMQTIPIQNPLPAGFVPLQAFSVARTPAQSRGSEDTELRDISVILKSVLWQSPQYLISGGLGIGIPTGEDTHVVVTDYLGGRTSVYAEIQRQRDFVISNETISLSPFLAALATPTDRFYMQGFVQYEQPVNDNSFRYSSTFSQIAMRLPASLGYTPVFAAGDIREAALLHMDGGAGYWLIRNPCAKWITGLAPTIELHYTTTLESNQLVSLPPDGSQRRIGNAQSVTAPGPQIGTPNSRIDILDLTVGSTIEIANRATLATGIAVPLKRESDRTFDWELQVMLNIYFGAHKR